MKKQICFVFLSCFLGNACGQEVYNVQLRCNKKERQVVTIARGIQDYVLKLIPPVDYEIEDSGILSQIHDFWHEASLDEFDLFMGFSGREYVLIGGKLKPPPSGKRGSPPWFAVEVPSVDIDWAGYTAMQDEEGEDERIVQCPLRSGSQPGKAVYLSVRGENLTPHNSVKVMLTWDDPSLRILDESGNPVGNGVEFPIGSTGKTLYADPGPDTGVFSITFQGPEGKTGRAADRVYGCVNPGILTRTVAEEPANVTRKILGVGEEVDLWLYGISGDVNWRCSEAASLSIQRGNKAKFTAPNFACVVTVTAECNQHQYSVQFSVIEPSGVRFRYRDAWMVPPPQTPATSGFYAFSYLADMYFAPDTVNFGNVLAFEGYSDFIATGSFTNMTTLKAHEEGDGFKMLTKHVKSGLGTHISIPDNIGGRSPSIPFYDGSFLWNIPWYYRVSGTETRQPICYIEQKFELKAYSTTEGKFIISKETSSAYVERNNPVIVPVQ